MGTGARWGEDEIHLGYQWHLAGVEEAVDRARRHFDHVARRSLKQLLPDTHCHGPRNAAEDLTQSGMEVQSGYLDSGPASGRGRPDDPVPVAGGLWRGDNLRRFIGKLDPAARLDHAYLTPA